MQYLQSRAGAGRAAYVADKVNNEIPIVKLCATCNPYGGFPFHLARLSGTNDPYQEVNTCDRRVVAAPIGILVVDIIKKEGRKRRRSLLCSSRSESLRKLTLRRLRTVRETTHPLFCLVCASAFGSLSALPPQCGAPSTRIEVSFVLLCQCEPSP